MKTIQEHLRELDTDKLIDTYLYEYPLNYKEFDSELTVGQINMQVKQNLVNFIERLRTIEAAKPENDFKGIFYVHRMMKKGEFDVECDLANIIEILENDDPETGYAYEFCDQSEIMGYYVADTELTKKYIYELAASVIYEASFFGFNPNEVQKARNNLEERIEKIDSGECNLCSWDEVKSKFKSDYNFTFDEKSPDEIKRRRKVTDAETEYNMYSAYKEIRLIREMLKNNSFSN